MLAATMLLAGCAAIPQHPAPLETDFVPTSSPAPSIDRGSLSPDGFTAAQRMTVRVRNIGCNGLSTGTGFAVDANTLVTNRHVVENSRDIEVTTYDGRTIEVTATAVTTLADLAVVTTDEPLGVWSSRASADPVEGDAITVVGYPLGGQLTTVAGVVLGQTTDPLGASGGPVFATTAPVQPGSSGSPALNEAGEVVGVIYAKNDAEQSFMIPVSTLRTLLDQDGLLEPTPNVCPAPTLGAIPGT
jgi:S1-C subfamily serine protease